MTSFVLPRGATGFSIDDTPAEAAARLDSFHTWCRAFATATNGHAELADSSGRFDVVFIEQLGLWFLQNRFLPLVGVLEAPPTAGFAYAVEGTYVDIEPPAHLTNWGPTRLRSHELNRLLRDDDWARFSPPARAHADRFKPTTVGHVIFNYWDH